MNRKLTNKIRFILDECLPPIIRDNKLLMYPLFYIWFKGKNVKRLMEFKSYFHKISESEYSELYNSIGFKSNDRETDLHKESLDFIISNIGKDREQSILDVGCGKGFLLRQLKTKGFKSLYGCDILNSVKFEGAKYSKCNIENLNFEDRQFDIVTCNHTLEHVLNLDLAIQELKRITKKKLIITVPCQKYFHYTFDLHIHFFPEKSFLEHRIDMKNHLCENKGGDWVYVGSFEGTN